MKIFYKMHYTLKYICIFALDNNIINFYYCRYV